MEIFKVALLTIVRWEMNKPFPLVGTQSHTTKLVEDGIALNYDAANRLAGIEILDAAHLLDNSKTRKQVVFETSALTETGTNIHYSRT